VPATISDVLPAAAALLGVPGAEDRLGLSARVGPVRRAVVLLVDGMGHRLLPAMAPHAPLLAQVLAGSAGTLDEFACTFPSTTPTSLVSLGTGALPGAHGVLGFTLNIPNTDRVLTHITWRDDPPPRAWQPVPTWYEQVGAAGFDARVVLPAMFAGSGLTDAAYRGARFRGVGARDDYAQALVDEVRAGPGLIYGYTPALDTAAHLFGIASEQWRQAAAEVDALLARVVTELPDDATLLVTADHGGLDVAPDARFDAGTDRRLTEGVRVIAGEPRVRYVHTVIGAVDDVRDSWQFVLGAGAQVLMRDDAIGSGLFGAVPPAHAERIGDLVVICTDPVVVLATDREPPAIAKLVGFHGALTAEEMAIPLITFTPAR
jgi:hypothetical protein